MVGSDRLWESWAIRTGEGGPLKAIVPLHPPGRVPRSLLRGARGLRAPPARTTLALHSHRPQRPRGPQPFQRTGPVRRLTPDLAPPQVGSSPVWGPDRGRAREGRCSPRGERDLRRGSGRCAPGPPAPRRLPQVPPRPGRSECVPRDRGRSSPTHAPRRGRGELRWAPSVGTALPGELHVWSALAWGVIALPASAPRPGAFGPQRGTYLWTYLWTK